MSVSLLRGTSLKVSDAVTVLTLELNILSDVTGCSTGGERDVFGMKPPDRYCRWTENNK